MCPAKLSLEQILAVAEACGVRVDPTLSDPAFIIATATGPIALSLEEIVPYLFGEAEDSEGFDDADRS